jgi:hypothetical protein
MVDAMNRGDIRIIIGPRPCGARACNAQQRAVGRAQS